MMPLLKKPSFILFLIIIAFLFREIFLAGVFPLFTGQDEARHYNTVQWLSVKQDFNCIKTDINEFKDKEDLATYQFSEEIRQTSAAANLSIWRKENYQKPVYILEKVGINEERIQEQSWKKETDACPPDIVSQANRFSFFHWMASGIENTWKNYDILTRFYLVRILTLLLGTLTILLAYLAATEAGFSRRIGLLISLILSLQPRLSIYTTNINYDTLLIPFFALFIWGSLRCLQRGTSPLNLLLLIIAFTGAILTKGTGLILLGGLIFLGAVLLLKQQSLWKQVPVWHLIMGSILVLFVGFFINNAYTLSRLLPELSFPSLMEYLSKSLTRIPSSSENFWGTMSWNESNLGPWFVFLIWFIEAVALYGLVRYFYLKESLSFLPTKSVVFFCLALIASLQLGVRFHDWHVFQETGSLVLGTPGRYFLPTIIAQMILVTVGLGALLRQKLALERVLVALAVIMLAFNFYTTWLIIIPRFYL